MGVMQAGLSADLAELVKRAGQRYEALSPSQRLRHRYMQRRAFSQAFGDASKMPHEVELSDAEIGLILAGEPHGRA